MPSHGTHTARPSGGGGSEPAKVPLTKFALAAADIRDLYETARSLGGMGGAPYLNRLFDAEAALNGRLLSRVQDILARTRQEFEKSHARLLRFQPDDGRDSKRSQKEAARLGARKKQVEDVLSQFDEYLAVIGRMVDVQDRIRLQEVAEPPPSPLPPRGREVPTDLPAGLAESLQADEAADARLTAITRDFAAVAVESAEDIAPARLYFLRTRTTGYVLRTAAEPAGDRVRMVDVLSGQEVRPQPLEALLEQGKKGKLLALVRHEPGPTSDARPIPDIQPSDAAAEPLLSASPDPLEAQNALLDRQLFNILMLAVKDSGLGVSTDLIVQVRDNEFRKGQYLDAFEKLNQLATRYDAAAARRKEELRQHDQWLSSGQSGLSIRQVEEAKLRNSQERTRLEHASHRFGLVVEPLRILSRGSAG